MNTLLRKAKSVLFPGLDLNTRKRYQEIPRFFLDGNIDTLDAGFGNGAFSYAAYQKGNRVLGISISEEEVRKANDFYGHLPIDRERLSFRNENIYNIRDLGRSFDQIICLETLEHIKDDEKVIRDFYHILRPGGVLHLCCPYALHPDHNLGRVDGPEDGGHVRDGYTFDSYDELLKPAGFNIIQRMGVGSPLLIKADKIVRSVRNSLGDAMALPLFVMAWPVQRIDPLDPNTPYSIYVCAVKK